MIDDFRHAVRIYRQAPVATVVAIGVLAIGMALVAAFVSMYVDLILRPHAGFERGARLVTFRLTDGRTSENVGIEVIDRIADESVTLEAVAGTSPTPLQLVEGGGVIGEIVTRGFFGGVRPRLALGRGFEQAEHAADGEPVVVISHRYWLDAYDGRVDVIGTTLELQPVQITRRAEGPETIAFRIVGVMAPGYTGNFPRQWGIADFWLPIEQAAPDAFDIPNLRGIGRRKAGAGTAAAVARELDSRFLEDVLVPGLRFEAFDGLVVDSTVHRNTEGQLRLFLAGSVLLALIAAANVSLFLLARAPGRRRELGIRMAVGAPLRRLARQLASEAGVLVAAATACGLGLSVWLAQYMRNLNIFREAQWRDITLFDWRVLGIVGAFSALLVALVSLAPTLGLKRVGIAAISRQVSARPGFGQRIVGTAQIAIAAMVGAAAVAFASYLAAVVLAHPGYETRNIHVVEVQIPGFNADNGRMREAILGLPGVTGVSFASTFPAMGSSAGTWRIPDRDDPGAFTVARYGVVDGAYVDVLGLKLAYGHAPTEPGTLIVNRTLARSVFGREEVVGEHLLASDDTTWPIVGVLEDVAFDHPLTKVEPLVFRVSRDPLRGSGAALIESEVPPGALRAELQQLIDSGALDLWIMEMEPLASIRARSLAADRARTYFTLATAGIVLLLAGSGFYGTQRYLVAAGRREYAIRASLGAGRLALGRLVMTRGLLLGVPGIALGMPLAFIVVVWLRNEYVSRNVSPVLVALAVAIGLAALVLVASIGPARQARETPPAPLLRED